MTEKRKKAVNSYLKYAGLGVEIVAAMLLCIGIGYGLDQYLKNEIPWFTLVFSLIGCGMVIYLMIRALNK